ncbi:hypothetical protein SAMN04487769_2126 [Burkholderia sp. b14]|nr:hypothetical protein SAMN04487769_2126 [Burkholderia sp. b14]
MSRPKPYPAPLAKNGRSRNDANAPRRRSTQHRTTSNVLVGAPMLALGITFAGSTLMAACGSDNA